MLTNNFLYLIVTIIASIVTSIVTSKFYLKFNMQKMLAPSNIIQANIYNLDNENNIPNVNNFCSQTSQIYELYISYIDGTPRDYTLRKCSPPSHNGIPLRAIIIENLDTKTARLENFSWNSNKIFPSLQTNNIHISNKEPIIIYCDTRDLPDTINFSLLNYVISLQYNKFSFKYNTSIKKS